ncbi:elongation factor G [Fodinicurvata sp. EGI_FJ10296]|uniref:elongation factor G n=1 Tax=Fodinicurvata sp. EGI_FJ10296 TaxID=3231908 RepID=UPI003454DC63
MSDPSAKEPAAGERAGRHSGRHRCAALVGPQGTGKTTLMEAMLYLAGAIHRRGTVKDGTTVGDASEEARQRQMSVAPAVAGFDYLGDRWAVIDCPGAVDLAHRTADALMVADIAIVVADPDPDRAVTLQPLLHTLDEIGLPHIVFINRLDSTETRVRDVMQAIQDVSERPLVLRQIPIRDKNRITGYVDLVSHRAWHYRPGQTSDLIEVPADVADRRREAYSVLTETLADFDDGILEKILEDVEIAPAEIYDRIRTDFAEDRVVPVMIGSAENMNGVQRLMKALRHDAPDANAAAERHRIPDGDPVLQVFRTEHAAHAGRMSYVRLWRGRVGGSNGIPGVKPGALLAIPPAQNARIDTLETGDVAILSRQDDLTTGDIILATGRTRPEVWPEVPPPVYSLALQTNGRADDVKLSAALQKLADEDPALSVANDPATGDLVLSGQGDIHLSLAVEQIARRHGVTVTTRPPPIAYRETITRSTETRARHKKQTGGHGQFADVTIAVRPLARGQGFAFDDKVVGGAVPKTFIPAVEQGVRDGLIAGPLGQPVVDLAVTLLTGQFHEVDSSEQAFRTVGRQVIVQALPECGPQLLEPMMRVAIHAPSEAIARVQRLLGSRRAQIQGFDARPGWPGWDEVVAIIPEAETPDLIIALRSLTQGLAGFRMTFDHMAEVHGRDLEQALGQKGVGRKAPGQKTVAE